MNIDLSVLHLWKMCLEPELGDTTTMKKGLVFRRRSWGRRTRIHRTV